MDIRPQVEYLQLKTWRGRGSPELVNIRDGSSEKTDMSTPVLM